MNVARYTPAYIYRYIYIGLYIYTFIGCDKTPVFKQAFKIQKLNEKE